MVLYKGYVMSIAIVNASKITNDQIKSHENISGQLYNFGNRICSSGLQNILKDSTLFNIVKEDQLPKLEKFDKVVLSLQDHLRPAIADFLSFWAAKLPPEKTLIPSIGINAFHGQVPPKLDEDFTVFLREVSKYSKIGCRGKHTQIAFRSLGIKNTVVIGCPSVFNKTINPLDEKVDKQGLLTAGGATLRNGKKLTYLCQGDFDTLVTIDLENRSRIKRSYYAEKHIHVFGKDVPKEIASSCTRITRDGYDSPTSEELYQILGKAKILHAFEESAIIYEALLAGCVVNLHPAGSFKEPGKTLTEDELGLAGTISQQAPTEQDIENAQLEIPTHIDNYNKWVSDAGVDIEQLVEDLGCLTQTDHDDFYQELWKNVRLCNRYEFYRKIDVEKKISYKVVKACASIFPLIIRKKIRRGYRDFYNSLPAVMKRIL